MHLFMNRKLLYYYTIKIQMIYLQVIVLELSLVIKLSGLKNIRF